MTDQERKAMEMALEWMEAIVNSNWRNWEELASPEEFERWVKSRANHSAVALRQALAQGKQEPVAWTLTEFLDKRETTTNAPLWFVDPVNSAWTPLYTAPPSKPEPEIEEQLADALGSLEFYRRRIQALEKWQSKMRDPERMIVCDIIANGFTLCPEGDRYTVPPSKPDSRLKIKLGRQYGGDLNGHWFYLQPADEYAEAALTKHSGISAPPCKPWVSLTDDELSVIWGEFGLALMPVRKAIANEIEAKLKELNHG